MATANYKDEIAKSVEILKAFRKSKDLFNKEKEILDLCKQRYKMCWSQIHEYLAPKKTDKAESEIQAIIKDIFTLDLPICEAKIDRFKNAIAIYEKRKDTNNVELCYQYLQEWLMLYDDNYALVCFRSLEHFALYTEWDKLEQDKFWKYSIDTFDDNGWSGCTKGFFYYGNKMILENKIKFMLKRMPTSFGKSFSDSVMISFIFGYDKSEQVIKVVGNRSLPAKCTKQVVDIMCNPRYRKVFPEYAKDIDEEKDIASQIFSICSIKEGILTIKDCGRDTSYESFSKETKRDGIRGGWLFLDDIVQRKEIMNLKQHAVDLDDFDGTWKKRSRDENKFRIVCGGTSYDCNDLLATLYYRYSKGKVKPSKVNKWTTLSLNEDAVFVTVKKLDENDKLTFPQKTVLSSVLDDRKNNPDLFNAMDMQEPVPPEGTPFYWDYIRQYEYIPSENCSEYCYATLDPARTGDNYVSMPICKIVQEVDKDGSIVKRHYLVDCLYMKTPMDTVYGFICELVEKHHIIKLHIERNTDTSLKFLLDKLMKERDIAFCEISEVYSVKNKEDRIYANETLIKNKIVFPRRELYSTGSQMGQFMQHISAYKYAGSDYDDSIDSIGLYVDKFVSDKNRGAKAKLLYV